MEITFIEGLPGAGKSLLIKYFEKKGFVVTHELGRLIDKKEFPGNGESIEEILTIDDWFIEKEKNRMKKHYGFFDRSYLTHLTYAFAYGKLKKLNSFKKTIEKYKKVILTGKLELPDNIIYIDISSEESIKRQNYRILLGEIPLDPFWRYKSFLDDLRLAYNVLFSCTSGINIIRIDGSLPTHVKYELVIQNVNNNKNTKEKKIDLKKYVKLLS